MKKNWYLVAHRAGARLFEQKNVESHLALVETIDHPVGRLKDQEITTDRRGQPDMGHGTYTWTVSPSEHIVETFAKDLAGRLECSREENRFDTVTLVADPHLLGLIRSSLSDATRKLVRAEVLKNLNEVTDHDMAGALGEALMRREPIAS